MAEAPDPDENPFDFSYPPADKEMSSDEEEIDSDEKQCKTETETVFKSFFFTRLTSQIDKETEEGVTQVSSNIVKNIREEKMVFENNEKQDPANLVNLGRALAAMGDKIQENYREDFAETISKLNLTEDLMFDSFQNIGRRIFRNGINWGRIVALFYFGYELAVTFIRQGSQGIRSFLKKIIKFIGGFLIKEKIAKWIIEQGGWIKFKLQESDDWQIKVLVAVLVVAAGFGIYKYLKDPK